MWVIQGLASAACESAATVASHSAIKRWPPLVLAWWTRIGCAFATITFALCWHRALPAFPADASFWIPTLVSIGLNAYAALLFVRAMRHDLTLTMPITALSPIFMIFTEPMFTGSFMSASGLIGVSLAGLGLYVVNVSALRNQGLFGPFRNIWRQAGSRIMLAVVAIWSVTAPLDRLAVRAFDPLWYSATLHGSVALILTLLLWRETSEGRTPARRGWRLAGIGMISSGASVLLMSAYITAPSATYAIALRRVASAFTALWGWLYLKEPHGRVRLLGTLIMTAGLAIMLLSL